jgi:hypothetical protein
MIIRDEDVRLETLPDEVQGLFVIEIKELDYFDPEWVSRNAFLLNKHQVLQLMEELREWMKNNA